MYSSFYNIYCNVVSYAILSIKFNSIHGKEQAMGEPGGESTKGQQHTNGTQAQSPGTEPRHRANEGPITYGIRGQQVQLGHHFERGNTRRLLHLQGH